MDGKTYTASPSVTALARRLGVDLAEVARQSGRRRIAHEDVKIYSQNPKEVAFSMSDTGGDRRFWDIDHTAYGPVEHEPLSGFARAASENLSASNRMIPQVTHHDRADLRAIEALRLRLKPRAEQHGVKLTALAFHVKALSVCLTEFPRFNASLTADSETLVVKKRCHIGIAVDTPHGLVVPVIRNTNRKGLFAIAQDITDLAARAQQRRIKQTETGGASMSISNLGGIGGRAFTPIVNPPELAILGITRTETVPIWENASWVPVPMVPLDLSYDHRVINGADAARFMRLYCQLLEEPRRLMV